MPKSAKAKSDSLVPSAADSLVPNAADSLVPSAADSLVPRAGAVLSVSLVPGTVLSVSRVEV